MPIMYLPTVREHVVTVIPDAKSRHGNVFHVIDWDTTVPRRREALAGSPESLIDLWERDLVRLGDRMATWRFEHETHGTALVSRAIAEPTWLTTAERIDALLARIFVVSCLAAARGDDAEVARLDARYDRIETAYYHTPIGD